jgi:hypothetical protein
MFAKLKARNEGSKPKSDIFLFSSPIGIKLLPYVQFNRLSTYTCSIHLLFFLISGKQH